MDDAAILAAKNPDNMNVKYNQLKLGSRNGLYEYASLRDFYGMVLNALKGTFPDGKIDFMRFMMDWTRLTTMEIQEIMEVVFNYIDMSATTMDSTVVIVNWKNPFETRVKLMHLISVLVYCVNNEHDYFDTEEFNKAFLLFNDKAKPNANRN